MDINLIKNVINGVNLVKIGLFWWKWSKLGHLGPKLRHRPKFRERGHKNLSLKISKNYFCKVYGQKFGRNAINGFDLVKIGHFWWKRSKLCHFDIFWGPKLRHVSKFWEFSPIIFSLKFSTNYLSRVYGHKFDQKCH